MKDINEMAKKYTRAEFIITKSEESLSENCPRRFGLEDNFSKGMHCIICGKNQCRECIREAIKDIKFKDEL